MAKLIIPSAFDVKENSNQMGTIVEMKQSEVECWLWDYLECDPEDELTMKVEMKLERLKKTGGCAQFLVIKIVQD
jgi:hypothetical protein